MRLSSSSLELRHIDTLDRTKTEGEYSVDGGVSPINPCSFSESEVGMHTVMTLIPTAAVDLVD